MLTFTGKYGTGCLYIKVMAKSKPPPPPPLLLA